ncbi:MAG TPA: metallophosphoesterase, partial [Polyangiaceae bacterium]
MSRALSIAVFFTIALTLTGLAHYYVWVRLVRDPGLGPSVTRALTAVLIGLYLSIPVTFLVARNAGSGPLRALIWVAFVWLGSLLLLLVVTLAMDLGRGLYLFGTRQLGGPGPVDPDRRQLLSRLLAGCAALLAGGLGVAAIRSGLARVAVRELSVRLDRLPSELDGLTVVQLTDVHVGPTIQREFVEEIVASVNALRADVVAITGDLVDGRVEELREHVAPLGRLSATYGVFFVTGNHEYYSGADEWCAELGRLGIRVLRNERVPIGTAEASFDLAGIDDHQAAQFGNGHGADLARALAGRDPSRELVLLAHQPRAVFEARDRGVGLQLSGHTHGGQIWPWNFLVRLQQPVVSGLARFGSTLVYVSNGTGYWGPPMRLGAPAEITR